MDVVGNRRSEARSPALERIEMADLKERFRELEAIASGVDWEGEGEGASAATPHPSPRTCFRAHISTPAAVRPWMLKQVQYDNRAVISRPDSPASLPAWIPKSSTHPRNPRSRAAPAVRRPRPPTYPAPSSFARSYTPDARPSPHR